MRARLVEFARSRYDRERMLAFLDFTWQRFVEDRCFQTAGALSFTSVFALVPVTAAVLGILAAFPGFEGWREQLVNWVFINFVPAAGSAVQGYITEFAANDAEANELFQTLLREVARVLADDFKKRVIIVDTSNEIAGDGDIPHPGIGDARRMQVRTPTEQHQVMIEAVENHMPEVIVIDEIGTELEAGAARTIAERGV